MRATDWPAILDLANASVGHVPGAGSQETWFRNRRDFNHARGLQHHFVAEIADSEALVGYGAVESNGGGDFRLFVVTTPDRLDDVGFLVYSRCLELLLDVGARKAWFTEYAADEPLRAFATALGFIETRRFVTPGGVDAITLEKELATRDETA